MILTMGKPLADLNSIEQAQVSAWPGFNPISFVVLLQTKLKRVCPGCYINKITDTLNLGGSGVFERYCESGIFQSCCHTSRLEPMRC